MAVDMTGPPVMTLPKRLGGIRERHPIHCHMHTPRTWASIHRQQPVSTIVVACNTRLRLSPMSKKIAKPLQVRNTLRSSEEHSPRQEI